MKQRLLRPQIVRCYRVETNWVSLTCVAQRRHVHNSRQQQSSAPLVSIHAEPILPHDVSPVKCEMPPKDLPLAILPMSSLLRSYMITSMSSSPVLLGASVSVLRRMAASKSIVFSSERNPLLRWLLKRTFYAQFCAGENCREVQKTIDRVKSMGFTGVILEFALEVLDGQTASASKTVREIEVWRKGMLETVGMATSGDFVALK